MLGSTATMKLGYSGWAVLRCSQIRQSDGEQAGLKSAALNSAELRSVASGDGG
ncbi:hypothetical protein FB565_003023 [Actinoplanes lutulentus]|uniref:Uncharacterized protein n=1 Tax=Actinoplanes lutulentus TaxID=1287878 RepID=A0A327Z4N0_9ACTN|nr:hypothetical protein [Actinoplanes lutulentus]RAK28369.1 hypothetical protein B0I29_120137 [Actinoplanes lutulentus]